MAQLPTMVTLRMRARTLGASLSASTACTIEESASTETRSAVAGPFCAAARREITSAPKAVCWLSAAAPAQTLPASRVVTNAATVVLPRSIASPSGTPARR